jgi:excisionase family DNA binding protein
MSVASYRVTASSILTSRIDKRPIVRDNEAMNEIQEVFTPEQAAEYLQVSRETIYRYIREGKLIASKLGRAYRVPKHSLELLLWQTRTNQDVSLPEYLGEKRANGINGESDTRANENPKDISSEGKEIDIVDFLISTIGMLESEEIDLAGNVEKYVAEALMRKYP